MQNYFQCLFSSATCEWTREKKKKEKKRRGCGGGGGGGGLHGIKLKGQIQTGSWSFIIDFNQYFDIRYITHEFCRWRTVFFLFCFFFFCFFGVDRSKLTISLRSGLESSSTLMSVMELIGRDRHHRHFLVPLLLLLLMKGSESEREIAILSFNRNK